jgi:hypothetical protein
MQKDGGRACTRGTETISMQNREEMGVVVVERDSSMPKEECAAAEIQSRGMVHQMDLAHSA